MPRSSSIGAGLTLLVWLAGVPLPTHADAPLAYVDYQAAKAALAHAIAAGQSARLVTTLETRPLIALGIVFPHRREAFTAKQRLRAQGIDAFVRRYRHGGWIVHAGAHADPRLSARRLARLEQMGYRRIITHRVIRRLPIHRLVIAPPTEAPPSPPPAPPPSTRSLLWNWSMSGEHLTFRRSDQWRGAEQARLRLGASGRLASWSWKGEINWDAWREAATGQTALLTSPGEVLLSHRGNDGEWILGWQDPAPDGEIAVYDRIHRRDLTRPPTEAATHPLPAISWSRDTEAGHLRLLWSPWFQPALDFTRGGPWTPIDLDRGRLLGRRTDTTLRTLIQQGQQAGESILHGGFSLRLTRRLGAVQRTLALDHARASLPYYQVDDRLAGLLSQGADLNTALSLMDTPALRPIHPPGWALGYRERGPRWSMESALWTGVPYTTPDYRTGTTNALRWALGYAPDLPGRDHIWIRLEGERLTASGTLLDRRTPTRLKFRLRRPLRPGWRAHGELWLGLDRAELVMDTGLSLQPSRHQRITLSGLVFAGQEGTLGGFYRTRSHIALHWQYAKRP